MVEAAIVLPILLLTVLSVIMLTMYFYSGLEGQIHSQEKVIREGLESKAIFKILKAEDKNAKQMDGVVKKVLRREYVTKHYVFNMGEAIRLGKRITGE